MTHQTIDRDALAARQGERLLAALRELLGRNAFYTRKLNAARIDLRRLRLPDDLARLPFTTKAELVADQEKYGPWGSNLTEPLSAYTRYCQTSSTTGKPLRWLDTNESWQWMLECWKDVYRAAHVGVGDRVFFPFSFGPFLGFWAGFEAGSQVGLHCVPGGGMSTHVRLDDDRRRPADGRVLHAHLRAAAGRGGRRAVARGRAGCQLGAGVDRVGRARWQHPGHARAHRVGLGRTRPGSPRADRSGADQLRVLGIAGCRCT